MRRSSWTPSIVPSGNDETVYLVADDFGRISAPARRAPTVPCLLAIVYTVCNDVQAEG
jgi:hypothetical protein